MLSRAFACYGGKIITISSRRQLEGYQVGLRIYRPVNRKKVSSPLTASTIMSSPGSLTSACPRDLSGIEATSWRASFIIGWTCAHLMIDAWDEEGHVDNLFVPQSS